MQGTEKIIADIATLKTQQSNFERFVSDQIKICTADIKEHINKVGEKQRIDIQANRDYCEAENINIVNSIHQTNDRINKFKYTFAGGLGVISMIVAIIAWVVSAFAK